MLGFLSRVSKCFTNPKTKIILFNSLVRSNLEYCSQVWNPMYAVHSDRIERIQRKFLYHLSFAEGLAGS